MNYLGRNNREISGEIYIKAGSINIYDATVIQTQHSRPNKDKNGNNTQNPEVDYNAKTAPDGKRKTTYEL